MNDSQYAMSEAFYLPPIPRRRCAGCNCYLRKTKGEQEEMCDVCKPLKDIDDTPHPERYTNKTGYRGVSKNGLKYAAQICVDGMKKHLGLYDTPKEAHEAYLAARGLQNGT